ncbi:MAG: pyrroline-5-carboxylate reductase [Syntrophales bacterium]|jgi:pyrroline-5-carboxylate reductase|nr:pyrroline-5-carboxylate reductase [Syntrophales bacterium]
MALDKKVGMIGGGKMGSALIGGMISAGVVEPRNITVSDVMAERLSDLKKNFGVKAVNDNGQALKAADILLLAVKPQNIADVLEEIRGAIDRKTLLVSIAAGIPTRFIEERMEKGARVVRVMPNTPALVGEGMAAVAGGRAATEEDVRLVEQIFATVGKAVVLKEDLLDAVTGLSGSGPAYGFVIIEALADGGVRMGLNRDVAMQLAAQTLLGAAKLFLVTGKHPGELKDMVASPAGSTIAGLQALEEGKLRATLMAAVEAATLRSRELGETVR